MPPVTIESAKPPPSEPPRGIVAPYQPKDDPSGPAVVLKDDVLAMEEAQAATQELLREHAASSRRAPTVMNLKAPASAYPAPDFSPKRSKTPLLLVGGGLVLALVAVLAVTLTSGSKEKSSPVPAALTATPPAIASPEPALEAPPPLPPEAAPAEPSARESEAEPRTATDTKPPTKKAAPKAPAKTGQKPASGTTAPPPKKSGVIVRDTPF
jgi:hypothetical protein